MKKKLIIYILLVFLLGLCLFSFSVFYILTHAFIDTTKNSDAIIALAGGTTPDGYPCTVARAKYAAMLYKKGIAPVIIFAGGKLPVDFAVEAEVMKQVALYEHIPVNAILVEGQSHNTYQDVLFSKQILAAHSLHTVVLVTDPLHEPRAALLAHKDGISYTLSPAIDSPCTQKFPENLKLLFHESVGIIYYKIIGRW